jgi:hypothetical protein
VYDSALPTERPHLAAPAPDSVELTQIREHRLKEIATGRVTREVAAYLIYLFLLVIVAANNHDSRSYLWTNSVRGLLSSDSAVAEVWCRWKNLMYV